MAVAQFDFLEPILPLQEVQDSTDKMSDTIDMEPVQIEQVIQQNESSLETLQNLLNLQENYDTAFMTEEIPEIQKVISRVKAQIIGGESGINLQLLNELENLLKCYGIRIGRWQAEASSRASMVLNSGKRLVEIKSLMLNSTEFQDTTLLPAFLNQNQFIAQRIEKVDSLYAAKRLDNLQVQSQLSALRIQISELEEDIRNKQRNFRKTLFQKDSHMADPGAGRN